MGIVLYLLFLGGTRVKTRLGGTLCVYLWLQKKQYKAFPSVQFPEYFWEIRP